MEVILASMFHVARFPLIAKARVDASRLSVVAPLTYPCVDLDGDYVAPDGGNFDPHKSAGAWVGLEHWRYRKGLRTEIVQPDDPLAGRPVIVGYARESLDDPDGEYAVELKQFNIKGIGAVALPVGTTYYDPDNKLSAQVFALIEREALPGVSLEFDAPDGYKPTVLQAKSLRNPDRPAWRFDKWNCHGWVNCARPVNPGALVAKSQVNDKLKSILSVGKIGTETVHPMLFKAFAAHVPAPNRSTVRVEKAMDEPTNAFDDPTVYDDAHDELSGEEEGTPTAQAAYDAAQMLVDVCERIKDGLKKSEHVQGKKQLMKLCDQVEAMAEKFIATGDKVTSDVCMGENATGELSEDDDEVEEGATEPDEEDPDKAMKAFRAPHRKIYRKSLIRPFTRQQIADAPVIQLKSDKDEDDPADLEREARAERKFKKYKWLYGS